MYAYVCVTDEGSIVRVAIEGEVIRDEKTQIGQLAILSG